MRRFVYEMPCEVYQLCVNVLEMGCNPKLSENLQGLVKSEDGATTEE